MAICFRFHPIRKTSPLTKPSPAGIGKPAANQSLSRSRSVIGSFRAVEMRRPSLRTERRSARQRDALKALRGREIEFFAIRLACREFNIHRRKKRNIPRHDENRYPQSPHCRFFFSKRRANGSEARASDVESRLIGRPPGDPGTTGAESSAPASPYPCGRTCTGPSDAKRGASLGCPATPNAIRRAGARCRTATQRMAASSAGRRHCPDGLVVHKD